MPDLIPVDHDPYNDPPTDLIPVDHDPWAIPQTAISPEQTDKFRKFLGNTFMHTVGAPGVATQPVQPSEPGMWSDEDEARRQATEAGLADWAPQQALNMIGGGSTFASSGALGSAGGAIKAFHGSPHDFDKFDISKIGTGEGAQVYGHGLYFAEHPNTAQQYRDNLAGFALELNGKRFVPLAGSPEDVALAHLEDATFRKSEDPYSSAMSDLLVKAERPYAQQNVKDAVDVLKKWDDAGAKLASKGKMYEVNINADPEHFLDWDKPISEQHPKVRDVLSKYGIKDDMTDLGEFAGQKVQGAPLTAGNAYGLLANGRFRGDQGKVTEAMREAGIPGIKYLDQGSRGISREELLTDIAQYKDEIARMGSSAELDMRGRDKLDVLKSRLSDRQDRLANWKPPTSNYVVFHDKLIDIVKKYGLAGLVAGGAAHFKTTPVDHDPYEAQQ